MNPETLLELLQTSFRVTVGATASLVETIQDPQKRQDSLSKLQAEWSQLTEEWAEKGSITEQEARRFVDTLIAQRRGASSNSTSTSSNGTTSQPSDPIPTTAVAVPDFDVQSELQELTAQITALREELANLES